MVDKIIVIVCGILFALTLLVLVLWLKIGKQHFIEKRCPHRLQKAEDAEKEQEKNDGLQPEGDD